MLETYRSITIFNQQGLEKLNDELTQSYFRSTNHGDGESLKQLLLKLNRLQELVHSGHSREKQARACKLCKKSGHNSRTCTEYVCLFCYYLKRKSLA